MYLPPQNSPRAIVLTLGNKVVLYCDSTGSVTKLALATHTARTKKDGNLGERERERGKK